LTLLITFAANFQQLCFIYRVEWQLTIGYDEFYRKRKKNIDTLMKKGEKNLRDAELKTLRTRAAAAETYKD